MEQIMQKQPIINIGMIGHVANGKSSLTECLTGIRTQKFGAEKERNITIRLGYANAKIWKCPQCPDPECYSSTDSTKNYSSCEECNSDMKLVSHISIVDCPGHNMLTSTMMNGSSVMNYTLLVESASNQSIPAPQTTEHLQATQLSQIPNIMVCMNKIDIVKKDDALMKINQLRDHLLDKHNLDSPIIPISATFKANLDLVCKILGELPIPHNNVDDLMEMICIRSFDINKPGTNVTELKGGVIGGSIKTGKLNIGDHIVIYPGNYSMRTDGCGFQYQPLHTQVLSIHSDKNEIMEAIPGGLLGVQTTLDPAHTKNDLMTGSLIVTKNINEKDEKDMTDIKVYDKIILNMDTLLVDDPKEKMAKNKKIKINFNSNNIDCEVYRYSVSKNELKLILNKPIAINSKRINYVTVMSEERTDNIIGRGVIIDGEECLLNLIY